MAHIRWLQAAFITVILFHSAFGKPSKPNKPNRRMNRIINPDASATWMENENHKAQYKHPEMKEGDMVIARRFNGQNRNVLNDKYSKWPNKIVPYEFAPGFNAAAKAAVEAAIADYHKFSCIRYLPRNGEKDYVQFIVDDGCYSYVGRSGGRQPISIGHGCEYKGIAIHEMLHTVGFFHEQSRTNRDEYITIESKNVEYGMDRQFEKITKDEEITYGTEYDYLSVMHYGRKAFSSNGKDTITTKDPNAKIGQRQGFSETDLEKLNKHYECTEFLNKPKTTPKPEPKPEAKPDPKSAEEKKSNGNPPPPPTSAPEEPTTQHTTVATTPKKKCGIEHYTCKDWASECKGTSKTAVYIRSVCLQTCKTCVD